MPEYRRAYVPGGTFFLTLVTYHRTPLFSQPENIARLRAALAKTRTERPFEITGAVVLPDHLLLNVNLLVMQWVKDGES
jgi:putative transposase